MLIKCQSPSSNRLRYLADNFITIVLEGINSGKSIFSVVNQVISSSSEHTNFKVLAQILIY